MRLEDIDILCCVDCGGVVNLAKSVPEGDRIAHGMLVCQQCGRAYPILRQVAVMFRREVLHDYLSRDEISLIREYGYEPCLDGESSDDKAHQRQVKVANNWVYQWSEVSDWTPERFEQGGICSEESFWSFIPLAPSELTGRTVLVACAGRGREVYHIAKARPARIVINEIGTEIYAAPQAISGDIDFVAVRSDVSELPIRQERIDIAICDHALQHVLHHKRAFANLVGATRPGGTVAICVYSWENNGLMNYVIEPLKPVFHLFPLAVQRMMTLPMAAVLYVLIHCLYRPLQALSPKACGRLPIRDTMLMWGTGDFRTLWLSCFDFVHAPISYHFRRSEVEALASTNKMAVRHLQNTNQTLWSLVADKVPS